MQLVFCSQCKAQIADQTKTCPQCGAPGPGRSLSSGRLTVGAMVLAIAAGLLVWWMVGR